MGALKEKLQKSEERADGLHSWAHLPFKSRKKEIEALQKVKVVLRTEIIKLTAKADLERFKLQKELQKRKIQPYIRKLLLDSWALFNLSITILTPLLPR